MRTACNNNGLGGGSSFAPAVVGPWALSSPRSLAPARPVITAVSIAGRSLLGVGNEWIVVQGRQVRWAKVVLHGNAIFVLRDSRSDSMDKGLDAFYFAQL